MTLMVIGPYTTRCDLDIDLITLMTIGQYTKLLGDLGLVFDHFLSVTSCICIDHRITTLNYQI
jgi:hypothetical protein